MSTDPENTTRLPFPQDDMPHLIARFNAVDKTRQMLAVAITERLRAAGNPFVGDGGDVIPEAIRSLTPEEHDQMHMLEEGFNVYPFVAYEEPEQTTLGIELVRTALADLDEDAADAYVSFLCAVDLIIRCFNCNMMLLPDQQDAPCTNCGDSEHVIPIEELEGDPFEDDPDQP